MGNICRSPMAEAMFRHALPEKQFFSAGLDAPLGHAADAHACDLMRERGLDIGAHRARGIEGWMLLESDLILTMEKSHKDYLELRYPVTQGKVMRLGEALRCDIPDPYGKDRQAFEQACELMDQCLSLWLTPLRYPVLQGKAPYAPMRIAAAAAS